MILYPQRILTDQVLGEHLDSGPHDLGTSLDNRFAPADDAIVGFDPAEQPSRRDEEKLDTRDPHAALP